MGSEGLRIAVLPGDGIGPEVTQEGLKVLEAVADDPVVAVGDGELGDLDRAGRRESSSLCQSFA